MLSRLDLAQHLGDLALGVDHERRSLVAEVFAAIHRLLDPHAIRLGDGVILIGEQREVE